MQSNIQHDIKRIVPDLYVHMNKEIGRGDYGRVYEGILRQKNKETKVAVKVFTALTAYGFEDDIIREINCLSLIKSDNITKFYGARRTKNHIYLISEFCSEGTLASRLQKYTKLPEKEALSIMKQITKAFFDMSSIVHNNDGNELSIMHRDLKPQNIMFNEGKVKLIDFGFSKIVSKSDGKLNRKQTILGTRYYVSPQILDETKYSSKTDVWSAGVILYEIITGQKPWQIIGNDEYELFLKIKKTPLVLPLDVSDNTKDLLRGALQFEDEKRLSWEEVSNHPALKDI